jgi:superfamily II DNA/RNA helicase
VGTVGRVLDLISRHSLVLHDCRFVVLDEADEMLDLGFLEDVERILSLTPNSRQTALFSATMPPPIRKLADNYLYEPELVKVASAKLTVDTVEQFEVEVKQADKAEKLVEVLRAERPDQAIVFVRTKVRCDQLNRKLQDQGLNVKALHGDMSQGARDGVMLGFKGGRVPILVATDVAARGLDISTVTHVINFDVPISPDVYVHRIGRTGRVGRSGRAVTFVEPRQQRELEAIEEHIKTKLTPWAPGATTDAAPVEEKPRRHDKPHVSRNGDEPYQRLVAGVGAAAASRWPTSSTRSPRPRAWTARPCATSSSSSASRCCPCRAPRPPAWSARSTAPRSDPRDSRWSPPVRRGMAASPASGPCRSCGAALAPEQDWCLDCGTDVPAGSAGAGWKPVAASPGSPSPWSAGRASRRTAA